MIVELTVENLAIIERSQLSLGSGFTVLTGETGAGKSLLIDAIELALGERADSDLVRTGTAKASVSVVLNLGQAPQALAKCEELGLELEDGLLYLQREVAAEGRSQSRIGGKLTPASVLKQVGQVFVDLHGQHAHQTLLDPAQHLGYLDSWIGRPAQDLLANIHVAHEQTQAVRKRLEALRAGIRDREHRLDLLRFQVREIEAVRPRAGEMDELETQLSRLKHVEKLATSAYAALQALGEREDCAVDQLGVATKSLEDAIRFDPSLEAITAPLNEAFILLEEATHSLRNYAESLESDPASLDEVALRIDALKRLRRKYGETEEKVLEFLEGAASQLALLEDSEGTEADLEAQVAESEKQLASIAKELTHLRQERAHEFSRLVQEQLRDLAMDRAIFQVSFKPKPVDADGGDAVEFFFSANAGEIPRPLAKIASGGEISRVMLAIKTALAGKAGVPTLIFDEVDAGLGGRAAATMGRKLEELAQHYQVLVISHSPQIAARAGEHFRIEKIESAGRVIAHVRHLTGAERVEEIARMLAGEAITDSALANAREMLAL